MKLPTQDEVNAAARHVASFAGGAVVMFGLGTKINPDTLKAAINAMGNLTNDVITLIGIVGPAVAAYVASRSASQTAQVKKVLAMPGIDSVKVNAQASPELAQVAVDPLEQKIAATPASAAVVAKTAAAA